MLSLSPSRQNVMLRLRQLPDTLPRRQKTHGSRFTAHAATKNFHMTIVERAHVANPKTHSLHCNILSAGPSDCCTERSGDNCRPHLGGRIVGSFIQRASEAWSSSPTT